MSDRVRAAWSNGWRVGFATGVTIVAIGWLLTIFFGGV